MSLAMAWKAAPWRRVANATWAPLWLLSLSLVLIAVPLWQWPVRLVLNLLPFAVLFLAVWWVLRRVAQPRTVNLALGVLCVGCVIPAYAEHTELTAPVRARMDSPVLWSHDSAASRSSNRTIHPTPRQLAGRRYGIPSACAIAGPIQGAGKAARGGQWGAPWFPASYNFRWG